MESVYSVHGTGVEKNASFWEWVYEKGEKNKYSCKPEEPSGSLQIIR